VTYFCTCYGEVDLGDKLGKEHKLVVSGYHTPHVVYAQAVDGRMMASAELRHHSDEELIMLERLVGRTSPILLRNRKLQEREPEVIEAPKQPAAAETPSKPAEPKEPAKKAEEQQQPAKVEQPKQPAKEEEMKQAPPTEKPAKPAQSQGSKKGPKKEARKPARREPPPEPRPEPSTLEPLPEQAPTLPAGGAEPQFPPAPTAPAPTTPPEPEYRLPPPRLD